MSRQHIDGFESGCLREYAVTGSPTTVSSVGSPPDFPNEGLCLYNGTGGSVAYTLSDNGLRDMWIAFRWQASSAAGTHLVSENVVRFYHGSTEILRVYSDSDGDLHLWDYSTATTPLGIGSSAIHAHRLVFHIDLEDGLFSVLPNGFDFYGSIAVTVPSGSVISSFAFESEGYYEDLVIDNETQPFERMIIGLAPNAYGSREQWVNNGGSGDNVGVTSTTGFTPTTPVHRTAQQITITDAGTIASVSVYHGGTAGGTYDGDFMMAIYSNSGGAPSSRLAVTDAEAVRSSSGWQELQLTSALDVTAGQTIWLAVVFENPYQTYYKVGTPELVTSAFDWSDGMPSTYGACTTGLGIYMPFYATYAGYDAWESVGSIPPDGITYWSSAHTGQMEVVRVEDCPDDLIEAECVRVIVSGEVNSSGNQVVDAVRPIMLSNATDWAAGDMAECVTGPVTPTTAGGTSHLFLTDPTTGAKFQPAAITALQVGSMAEYTQGPGVIEDAFLWLESDWIDYLDDGDRLENNWLDLSNGLQNQRNPKINHYDSATPTYYSSIRNFRPIVRMASGESLRFYTLEHEPTDWTWVFVYEPDSITGGWNYLLSSEELILAHQINSGKLGIMDADGSWKEAATSASGWQILAFRLSEANGVEIYRNGTPIGSAIGYSKAGLSSSTGAVCIGSKYDRTGAFCPGDYFGVFAATRALSNDELNMIFDYYETKANITVTAIT